MTTQEYLIFLISLYMTEVHLFIPLPTHSPYETSVPQLMICTKSKCTHVFSLMPKTSKSLTALKNLEFLNVKRIITNLLCEPVIWSFLLSPNYRTILCENKDSLFYPQPNTHARTNTHITHTAVIMLCVYRQDYFL